LTIQTSYTDARARFAELCDRAVDDRETIVIHRRGAATVALIAADELESLRETAYLLRSPKNAERLLSALNRALGRAESPTSIAELRADVGLG
jgi:antitoxin YefM